MSDMIVGWDKPLSRHSIGFASTSDTVKETGSRAPVSIGGEGHMLAIGRTGSGKGRNLIIPLLLDYRGSVVVIDVKGECAAVTARHRREMGQEVVTLDPFGKSRVDTATFNPMTAMLGDPEQIADASMVLAELIRGPVTSREPFWDVMAAQLIAGLIAAHATRANLAERCLGAVWESLMHENFSTLMYDLLDSTEEPLHPFARQQFSAYIQGDPRGVQTSVRTTAQQAMRVFGSPPVAAATRATSFSLADFREGKPMTIYIVIPPDKLETYGPLLRVWISALLQELTRRQRQPAIPTLFVIDELANIGPMPEVKQAVTLLRGYGVRCALFLQSLAQLKGMWPLDYETIIDNCEVLSIFGAPNLGAARQLEAILGDVSAETLLSLPRSDLALVRAGQPTRIIERLDYLCDPMFQGRYDRNPLYVR